MKRYFDKNHSQRKGKETDRIDFYSLKTPKLGFGYLNKSVQQLKKELLEKSEYERALKRLDISPNPCRYRNLFKAAPESSFKTTLKRNRFLQDYDVDEFIDAMFFRVNNSYLLINQEFGAPFDFFTVEVQVRNLKKFKPVFRGVEIDEVDKTPLEEFWIKYISNSSAVRWDNFEEAICRYFIININQSVGKVRKIDWDVLLGKLLKKISCVSNELELWPGHPGLGSISYKLPIVTLSNFQNCITSGQFKSLVIKSIKKETSYITERYKKPVYTFACGTEYKGNWKSYLRDGLSKLTLADYFHYNGYFFKGLRHGYGVCKADDSVYVGYWEADCIDGPGELTYNDGSSISGVWKQGKIISGNLKFSGGEYTGYFNSLYFEGAGTFMHKSGDLKKGFWSRGKLNGPCEVILKNSSTYKGTFKDDLLEGEGTIDTPTYSYSGFISKSLPEGEGSIIYKQKPADYKGFFIAGVINGKGVYRVNSDLFKGEFIHGKLTGKGEKTFSDFGKYLGEFSDSLMQGKGVLRLNHSKIKAIYSGELKLNKFHGVGRLKIENKEYRGEFANGELHGNGEISLDGLVFKGNFNKNEVNSKGAVHFIDGSYYNGDFLAAVPFGSGEALDDCGYWIASNFVDGKPSSRHRLKPSFFANLESFREKIYGYVNELTWINENVMINNFI